VLKSRVFFKVFSQQIETRKKIKIMQQKKETQFSSLIVYVHNWRRVQNAFNKDANLCRIVRWAY